MKSLSPALQHHILSLLDSGLSGHQISSQTGVSNATISKLCSNIVTVFKSPQEVTQQSFQRPTFVMIFALLAQGELKMQSRSPKLSGMLSTSLFLHKQLEMA